MIQVTVSMDEAGGLVITNAQGDLLAEGFLRAEDETSRELQLLGYERLIHTYVLADMTAGHGMDQDDLGEVFLEGYAGPPCGLVAGGPRAPRRG